MATVTNQFGRTCCTDGGRILEERLEVQGISHAEFARQCGRSPKLIMRSSQGRHPLSRKQLSSLRRCSAWMRDIWLGIEADYQPQRARESEAAEAEGSSAWVKGFPVKELAKRGAIRRPKTDARGDGMNSTVYNKN